MCTSRLYTSKAHYKTQRREASGGRGRGWGGGQSIPSSPFVDVVLYCILIYADVHN